MSQDLHTKPLLSVEDLSVAYHDQGVWRPTTHNISFQLKAGDSLALVGESGSGKTTTAQALIGLLPDNARIIKGGVRLHDQMISTWSQTRLRTVRGKVISLIPQDPGSSLSPLMRIGDQIAEVLKLHGDFSRQHRQQEVLALLEQVGLPEPHLRARQYPHELSGGMKQRVLIAMAIAAKPQLIIADEPTSALDARVRKHILDLIDIIRQQNNMALLMVTHDLSVASDYADRIIVMQKGRIEEQGDVQTVLNAPKHAYTRQLLANDPALMAPRQRPAVQASAKPIIAIDNLSIAYPNTGERLAVDDISMQIAAGTTHAIVGESGSGKTSTIRALCGFIRPLHGTIRIDDQYLEAMNAKTLRILRRKIQLVYQNPFSSLDPRQTIGRIIEEPLLNFERPPAKQRQERVRSLLDKVDLSQDLFDRRPAALSGGQRQRVAIARALVLDPQILVLDEAVSALDVTVQAQILDLLTRLQQQQGLTYVFVSHDLGVVRNIADTVSVMQAGKIVEQGSNEALFTRPQHPYTRALIASIFGRKNAQNHSYLSSQL